MPCYRWLSRHCHQHPCLIADQPIYTPSNQYTIIMPSSLYTYLFSSYMIFLLFNGSWLLHVFILLVALFALLFLQHEPMSCHGDTRTFQLTSFFGDDSSGIAWNKGKVSMQQDASCDRSSQCIPRLTLWLPSFSIPFSNASSLPRICLLPCRIPLRWLIRSGIVKR